MGGVIDLRHDVNIDMQMAQSIGSIFSAIGRSETLRKKKYDMDTYMGQIAAGESPTDALRITRTESKPAPYDTGLKGVWQRLGNAASFGQRPSFGDDAVEDTLMNGVHREQLLQYNMNDPKYQAELEATKALTTQRTAAATKALIPKPESVDQQMWNEIPDEDKPRAAAIHLKTQVDAVTEENNRLKAEIAAGRNATSVSNNAATNATSAANTQARIAADNEDILTAGDGTKWSRDKTTGQTTKIEVMPGKSSTTDPVYRKQLDQLHSLLTQADTDLRASALSNDKTAYNKTMSDIEALKGKMYSESAPTTTPGNPTEQPAAPGVDTGEMVSVVDPNGVSGRIPKANLAEALRQGYRQK